jgi:hypothetical protein
MAMTARPDDDANLADGRPSPTIKASPVILASSPNLRNLPDELLHLIVSSTIPSLPYTLPSVYGGLRTGIDQEFYPSSALAPDVTSIKHLRLVCHRLSHIATVYLLHRVRVQLTSRSLSRLEAIASHPTAAQGVRLVWLDPVYYRATAAASRSNWADFALRNQHVQLPAHSVPKGGEMASLRAGLTEMRDGDASANGARMDGVQLSGMLLAVEDAYRTYRDGYEDQQRLLHPSRAEEGFVQRFGRALARLPRVIMLRVMEDLMPRWRAPQLARDVKGMLQWFAGPHAWRDFPFQPADDLVRCVLLDVPAACTFSACRF